MNWRKSTYSLSNGNCVEVGAGPALVAIRDSNDPDGPVINVSPGEWTVFTAYVKRGGVPVPAPGQGRLRAFVMCHR